MKRNQKVGRVSVAWLFNLELGFPTIDVGGLRIMGRKRVWIFLLGSSLLEEFRMLKLDLTVGKRRKYLNPIRLYRGLTLKNFKESHLGRITNTSWNLV